MERNFYERKFIVLSVYFLNDNLIINSGGCFRLLKPHTRAIVRTFQWCDRTSGLIEQLSKSYFMPVSSTDSSPYVDGFYWVLWLMHLFSRVSNMFAFSLPIAFVCGRLYGKNIYVPNTVRKTHKLLQICKLQDACCKMPVHELSTRCVRTASSQVLKQVWNKLLMTCNNLHVTISDLLQGFSYKTDTAMI